MKRTSFTAAAFLVLASASVSATEFSADAITKIPGVAPQSGKIYISSKGTRFDFTDAGQKITQITRTDLGTVRVLLHSIKSYYEYKVPAQFTSATQNRADAPCKPAPALDCKMTGTSKHEGLDVEKWVITPKGAPKALEMLWNKSRKLAVHQKLPNGAEIASSLKGTEKYGGLDVERWETEYKHPNGQTKKGMMLFSTKINGAVVEQQPGGFVREMHNIKLSAPDAALFEVPEGFKKIAAPTAPVMPHTTGSIAK